MSGPSKTTFKRRATPVGNSGVKKLTKSRKLPATSSVPVHCRVAETVTIVTIRPAIKPTRRLPISVPIVQRQSPNISTHAVPRICESVVESISQLASAAIKLNASNG